MNRPMRKKERGFALIFVLWFLAGITSLSLASMLLARGALARSSNRLAWTRAEWRAEECIARARSAMTGRRRSEEISIGSTEDIISYRDAVLLSTLVQGCPGEVLLEPIGTRLDINAAGESLLGRVLRQQGIPALTADSLVAALMDWRDRDDSVRAMGAERPWYESRGARPPRNDDLAAVDELRLIRGFERWMGSSDTVPGIERVLSIEQGKVLIGAAPIALVAALPGLTPSDAVALEMHRLVRGTPLPEMLAIMSVIPEESHAVLQGAFGELSEVATVVAVGWILRVTSSGDIDNSHAPRLRVTIEVRFVIDGTRFAIVRRRIWS